MIFSKIEKQFLKQMKISCSIAWMSAKPEQQTFLSYTPQRTPSHQTTPSISTHGAILPEHGHVPQYHHHESNKHHKLWCHPGPNTLTGPPEAALTATRKACLPPPTTSSSSTETHLIGHNFCSYLVTDAGTSRYVRRRLQVMVGLLLPCLDEHKGTGRKEPERATIRV